MSEPRFDLLRKTVHFVREKGTDENFDMDHWVSECGTSACMAGWATVALKDDVVEVPELSRDGRHVAPDTPARRMERVSLWLSQTFEVEEGVSEEMDSSPRLWNEDTGFWSDGKEPDKYGGIDGETDIAALGRFFGIDREESGWLFAEYLRLDLRETLERFEFWINAREAGDTHYWTAQRFTALRKERSWRP